jgi:hypothetical protein
VRIERAHRRRREGKEGKSQTSILGYHCETSKGVNSFVYFTNFDCFIVVVVLVVVDFTVVVVDMMLC